MEKINIDINSITNDKRVKETAKAYVKKHLSEVPFEIDLSEEEIEDNIYKVYDYIKDYLYCSQCPGIEKCSKEPPYTTTKLSRMFGILKEDAIPCVEMKKLAELTSRYILRDYPEEWNAIDLRAGNLDKSSERARVMERIAVERKSTYVVGADKTGKSYLVTAIVNDLAKNGLSKICYLDTPYRVKEIYEAKDEDKEDMINRYSRCELLVLDKFGEEFVNDWIRDNILYRIIKFRSDRNLQTVYVSELNYEELLEHLTTSRSPSAKKGATDIVELIQLDCDSEIVLSQLKGLYGETQ